jgi:hypothetical protein
MTFYLNNDFVYKAPLAEGSPEGWGNDFRAGVVAPLATWGSDPEHPTATLSADTGIWATSMMADPFSSTTWRWWMGPTLRVPPWANASVSARGYWGITPGTDRGSVAAAGLVGVDPSFGEHLSAKVFLFGVKEKYYYPQGPEGSPDSSLIVLGSLGPTWTVGKSKVGCSAQVWHANFQDVVTMTWFQGVLGFTQAF